MKFVKIYGLQRTGTNYLTAMLKRNFSDVGILVNELGWKHDSVSLNNVDWNGSDWCSPHSNETEQQAERNVYLNTFNLEDLKNSYDTDQIHYLFCIKNPYSWYDSVVVKKDSHAYKNFNMQQIIEFWNRVNNDYYNFCQKNNNCLIIKYEDYYKIGYKHVMQNIQNKFNLISEKSDEHIAQKTKFLNLLYVALPSNHHDISLYPEKFKYDYYIEKKFLNSKTIEIQKYVDQSLMSKLNYNKMENL